MLTYLAGCAGRAPTQRDQQLEASRRLAGRSVQADEEGFVLSRSTHHGDVAQAALLDLLVELLRGVGREDDLVGGHVDGHELAGVALKVEVARHASMMPAGVAAGARRDLNVT